LKAQGEDAPQQHGAFPFTARLSLIRVDPSPLVVDSPILGKPDGDIRSGRGTLLTLGSFLFPLLGYYPVVAGSRLLRGFFFSTSAQLHRQLLFLTGKLSGDGTFSSAVCVTHPSLLYKGRTRASNEEISKVSFKLRKSVFCFGFVQERILYALVGAAPQS